MGGDTHLACGAVLGGLFLTMHDMDPSAGVAMGLMIGSLLPDIDHPSAMLTRRTPMAAELISRNTKHRHFTHSLLGLVLFFAIAEWLFPMIGNAFMAAIIHSTNTHTHEGHVIYQVMQAVHYFATVVMSGFAVGILVGSISHVVADMLNPQGVMLFWPLNIWVKPFPGIGIPTGSFFETIFMVVMLASMWFINMHIAIYATVLFLIFRFFIHRIWVPV